MGRDLRKYMRETNIRLIVGALVLLFIVGDGLIYIFYGGNAAIVGLLCILGGLAPVLIIALIILLLDWITNRANRD